MTKLTIAFRNFAIASKEEQRTFFIYGYFRVFFSGLDYISVKPRIIRVQIGKSVGGCSRGPFCDSSNFSLIL
jgi:hypothetical protein